jgi:hypothetical protein
MAGTALVTAGFTADTDMGTADTAATHKAEPLMQQPILAVEIPVAMVEALSKTTLFFLV